MRCLSKALGFSKSGALFFMKKNFNRILLTGGMDNGSKSRHGYHWLKDNKGNPQASSNRCRKEITLNLLTAGEGCLPRLLVFLVVNFCCR